MDLFSYLEKQFITQCNNVISITGGGGKTTLMIEFASYLKKRGYSVLLTTTTKVESPKNIDYKADYIFSDESVLSHDAKGGETVFYAEKSFDVKKWISPRLDVLSILTQRYDVVLIEADGSRRLPLKLHTERDPVIPKETTGVIGVMGASALGRLAQYEVFGDSSDRIIDKEYLKGYLDNPEGIKKGMRENIPHLILFNAADRLSEDEIKEINGWNFPIVLSSVLENRIYV